MVARQEGLELGATEDWSLMLAVPYPPSINHYFMEYAMPPAGDVVRQRIEEHGFDGIHQWLRKNTRTMKRVGERGHKYRADVTEIVLRGRKNKHINVPVKMIMAAYPPDRRQRDLSNLYKALEDALEYAGVITNDALIREHHSLMMAETVKGGRLELTFSPLV